MSDKTQDAGTQPGPLRDEQPRIQIITMADVPEQRAQPRGVPGHQFNRSLLNLAKSGTPEMVADFITFPPGFVHHMHRHFYAEQIMLPLSGRVEVYGEDRQPHELTVGQVMVIPRLQWHETRNVSDELCQVFHMFSGVGDIANIGFEMWAEASEEAPTATNR